MVPAALLVARELFGESSARKVAPFLVLMPSAVWFGTTPDGFFAGVVAVSIAAYVVACRRGSKVAFAVAGVSAAAAVSLTYGALPLLACTGLAGFVWKRRIIGSVIWVGGFAASLAWRIAGFDLVQGSRRCGPVRHRHRSAGPPLPYFVRANLAVVALAVGPAVVVALRLRGRPWLALASVLVALLLADVSGLSKAGRAHLAAVLPVAHAGHPRLVGLQVNARRLHLAFQSATRSCCSWCSSARGEVGSWRSLEDSNPNRPGRNQVLYPPELRRPTIAGRQLARRNWVRHRTRPGLCCRLPWWL